MKSIAFARNILLSAVTILRTWSKKPFQELKKPKPDFDMCYIVV